MPATWDRKERIFSCKAPPLSWYVGGKAVVPETLEKIKESSVKILLTLNAQDWIYAGNFEYYDPMIERLAWDSNAELDEGTEEEKKAKWLAEEQLAVVPTDPEELKEYEDEMKKKIEEENEEIENVFKRAGNRFYIYGKKFRRVAVNRE